MHVCVAGLYFQCFVILWLLCVYKNRMLPKKIVFFCLRSYERIGWVFVLLKSPFLNAGVIFTIAAAITGIIIVAAIFYFIKFSG